jgi:hypothetical protein
MNETKLTWKTAPISGKLCADTGGLGRFMIHPRGDGDSFELCLNTFRIGVYGSIKAAKDRAEVSFAALTPIAEGEV